jgi:NADH-quinone oxidoreductase subunit J
MSSAAIAFYIVSAAVLATALLSVLSRNIFRSAIYLLFALIGIAGVYLLMDQQFLAAVQTIVYVGGIVVLIIFSIFLTQQAGVALPAPLRGRSFFAGLAAISGGTLILLQLCAHPFRTADAPLDADMRTIGKAMLGTADGGYALPFELVSILLLAAMIGCIVIAIKPNSSAS